MKMSPRVMRIQLGLLLRSSGLVFPILVLPIFVFPSLAIADFSASLEQELALNSSNHKQKFETLFTPEWNIELSDNISMTFIGQARWDSTKKLSNPEGSHYSTPDNYATANGPLYYSDSSEVSIREWYIDTESLGAYWRIGKQQVVWGQADGLKVLDVVNPQNYREFILDGFEDSRIPLWMVNTEIPIGEGSNLQILWVPDLTYHAFAEAGTDYEVNSPLFRPALPQGVPLIGFHEDKPSSPIKDSDFGLQFSTFYQGWDLTLNYLYHYQDTPVLYQQVSAYGVTISSEYKRNHLAGFTASNAFGSFTLRTEVGYSSDTYHLNQPQPNQIPPDKGIHQSSEISSVIGLDWQGLEDTMISIQWFQSHLTQHNSNVVRPQNNHIVSLLLKRSFINETWDLEILALHGFDQQDGSVQSKLRYMLESDLSLWLGSDTFYGNKDGLFGQFNNKDRILFGAEWSF